MFKNETAIPDEKIEMLASALLPSVLEFWKSEHNQSDSPETDNTEAETVSVNNEI
ncbi:MAG: hypothetical protein IJK60_00975 [Clostridia bacterium]|nr:hypothetical protein [Clostridia bacterium]